MMEKPQAAAGMKPVREWSVKLDTKRVLASRCVLFTPCRTIS